MASAVHMGEGRQRVRKRYVGFRVTVDQGPAPDRRAMVVSLDRACRAVNLPDAKRLTVFTGHLGIAKCVHTEAAALVRALSSIDRIGDRSASVETVVTSGTIKKVKGHLGLDKSD
jgi:RNase P/RNase MRP subunit POP5